MLPNLLEGYPLPSVEIESAMAASAQVRSACGWHIAPVVTQDAVFAWSHSGVYLLPSLRVVAVAAVKVNGAAVAYDWSPSGEVHVATRLRDIPSINGPGVWGSNLRAVTVSFTHGYETCPEDVRQAVALRAARLGAGRTQTQSAGPFSYTSTFDSDPDADLASYRLPSIA